MPLRLLKLAGSAMTRRVAVSLLLLVPSSLSAADLATTQQALTLIAEFAERLCQSPELRGATQGVDLSGKAKAELSGIINKIAKLGLEGAAKYQTNQYQGLLQKDLANALKDSTNCRLKVWEDLKDKLIPPAAKPSASGYTRPTPVDPSSRKDQSTKDEFLLAGMRVSCNAPVSLRFSYNFPDASPSSRTAAAVVLQGFLRSAVLEKGELGAAYECTFDDSAYYLQVTPLEPRPVAINPRCRAYRETWSGDISEGRKITSENRACRNDKGNWSPPNRK